MKEESKIRRVVTIGGGHGQSVVLQALRGLECSIAAVVATVDDGGCSGELRREYGMPAPGDLRRCLSALALEQELAVRLEERISLDKSIPRCRGNLVIAQKYVETRSLQAAIDWVSERVGSVGRVMPASEDPGTLVVCDRCHGLVEGEYNVANSVDTPLVVTVTGAYRPNEAAVRAIEEADAIVMGPGSFCTSTLSALLTGEVGAAVCRSSARRLFILNVTNTESPCAGFREADFVSVLSSHLTICSLGETPEFAVLRHAPADHVGTIEDGTTVFSADIATVDGMHHSPQHMARALGNIFGISPRTTPERPLVPYSPARSGELRQALSKASEFLQFKHTRASGSHECA